MFRVAALGAIVLGLSCAAGGEPAFGQASGHSAIKPELKALFDIGWQRTFKARDEAQRQYEKLRRLAPGGSGIPYAYALVQVKQLRYAEAIKLIDEVLAAQPRNLNAAKLKIWLTALTRQYNDAMAQMEKVVELLPAQDAAAEAEPEYREFAAFLGRLCGYLEGPGKESVDELLLVKCRQRITDRLSASRRGAFEEARRSVAGAFLTSSEQTDEKAAAAEAEAAKQKQRVLEELQGKAEKLTAEIKEMEDRNEKLKKDLDYELQKIDTTERGVVSQLQRLEFDALALRNEARTLDDRISHALELADREKDPVERQRWLNDASYWRLHRDRQLAALDDLNRRAAPLQAERLTLQQRRANALGRYQQEVGRVELVRRALGKVRTEEAKAAGKPITGITPEIRDQKRRAAAFTTYVPLPVNLEQERDRLLESYH